MWKGAELLDMLAWIIIMIFLSACLYAFISMGSRQQKLFVVSLVSTIALLWAAVRLLP